MIASSLVAHLTARPERPVEAIEETRSVLWCQLEVYLNDYWCHLQVSGETRYMKIQNPGRANGGWKTPLKVKQRENIRVAMLPAVSASGIADINIWANVLAKTKN